MKLGRERVNKEMVDSSVMGIAADTVIGKAVLMFISVLRLLIEVWSLISFQTFLGSFFILSNNYS